MVSGCTRPQCTQNSHLGEPEVVPRRWAALAELTGQRTVPNIFVKGEHLGGNDDLQEAAQSGRLAELLGKK